MVIPGYRILMQLPLKEFKLVILIAVHQNPEQLLRLINTLRHPQVVIYLHIDKKSDIDRGSMPEDVKIVKNEVEVTWRLYSQVQAIVNSLQEIVRNEKRFDYVTFISGQDYPIIPIDYMLKDLTENSGTEFLAHVPLDQSGWNKARIRFERFYFYSYRNPFVRFFGKYITMIFDKLRWKRRFYKGLRPYGGSAWWTLTRNCVLYILEYLENDPWMVSYMKKTIHPDEILFQTIVMNSSFAHKTVNENYRFIEFIQGNPNPNILTANDFDRIIASGKHFARKLDTDKDTVVFDLLDQHRESLQSKMIRP